MSNGQLKKNCATLHSLTLLSFQYIVIRTPNGHIDAMPSVSLLTFLTRPNSILEHVHPSGFSRVLLIYVGFITAGGNTPVKKTYAPAVFNMIYILYLNF